MLKGKTVVVGVCGGIATYKTVEIVSKLKKLNADVNVIMTENSKEFVTPLTFRSISNNSVVSDMFEEPSNYNIKHISLAHKADIILIAPATANIIGKIANGIADDMLSTTVMASKAKVIFAPAMNVNMYENKIVQDNILRLKSLGYIFIEPETGMLACGVYDKGRLPEPESIINHVLNSINDRLDMENIKVLITAGPTREPIDPIRYISNHSSGKMGYSIANVASRRGASVVIVSGPVNIDKPQNVKIINVNTAIEMHREVMSRFQNFDVIIMAAAVADYRCTRVADKKIKKDYDEITLALERNPDIAYDVGKIKGKRVFVGFSAETDHLIENADKKLQKKNFDLIVANDVTKEGAGFNADTNIVTIIDKKGTIDLPLMSKNCVAEEILNRVLKMINKNEN